MWYDATSAAGSLEAPRLAGQGQDRLRAGAGREDQASGWLYTWAWAIQKASQEPGRRVEVHLLGLEQGLREAGRQDQLGWANVPAGKRASTYANPDYLKVAEAFAGADQDRDRDGRPDEPGRPAAADAGIQFVDIPEFTDLGDQVSQDVSAAIAGAS